MTLTNRTLIVWAVEDSYENAFFGKAHAEDLDVMYKLIAALIILGLAEMQDADDIWPTHL